MTENHLFVYGTLIPTEPAWPVVEPFALDHRPDEIAGALFDTTWGFPALSLDPAHRHAPVPGSVIRLDPELLGTALAVLDRYEGLAHDQYRRATVATASGQRCWVYEWIGPTGAFVRLDSGWVEHLTGIHDDIGADPPANPRSDPPANPRSDPPANPLSNTANPGGA